jgi:uncharacterized membrane protein (DUF485 family)
MCGFVVVSLSLSYVLMILTHRVISFEARRMHREEVGFIFAVVGIFTGLVIAAVLVLSISHYDKTKEAIEKEANKIGNVIRTARALSPALSTSVNAAMKDYLVAVSTLEWDHEQRDKNLEFERSDLNRLSLIISQFEPHSARETNYHLALLNELTDLYSARRERSFLAHNAITPQIWVATLLVGFLTIFFSFLFGSESRKFQFVLGSILTTSMAIIYSLILVFDSPYQGDVAVSNKPYLLIIEHLSANQDWFKNNAK